MASSSDPTLASPAWVTRFLHPRPRAWYDRPARQVARDLLGSVLVRQTDTEYRAVRLVETEAYVRDDAANHAFRGPTERNRSMFGRPGTLYVYRIHQVHCANVVTRPGEAVLLRSGEPLSSVVGGTRGPGRLARALGITRDDDGSDLVTGAVRLLPAERAAFRILEGPRVGIRRNSDALLRYGIAGDRWVSRPRMPIRRTPAVVSGSSTSPS
ncbi:MAG: DNA-3-methyladenine glycosylase [Thermoplasmata archaeon]|nr:DNA-3-methyladenine glycosylase [Thermoplasmata archaeon]